MSTAATAKTKSQNQNQNQDQEECTHQPPPISPHLTVHDAADAIEFYKRAFGAVEMGRAPAPDGKRLMHAALVLNGGLVMLADDFPEMGGGAKSDPKALGGTPVTIHLNLADVDAVWNKAVSAGATVILPLADQFWGDRYGVLADPYGHRWSLGTNKRKPSADEIAEGAKKAFGTA